jgi:hypothetical protein
MKYFVREVTASNGETDVEVREIKPASFRGKHNRIKLICFVVIDFWQRDIEVKGVKREDIVGIIYGLRHISSPEYIRIALGRWVKWRYVNCPGMGPGDLMPFGLSGKRRYVLTSKARNYLSRHLDESGISIIADLIRDYRRRQGLIYNAPDPPDPRLANRIRRLRLGKV